MVVIAGLVGLAVLRYTPETRGINLTTAQHEDDVPRHESEVGSALTR